MKIKRDGTIKKRVKQREDMFLRRLMGMLAEMAKADGDAFAELSPMAMSFMVQW